MSTRLVSVNPAMPEDVVATATTTGKAELDDLVAGAERAQVEWAARDAGARAAALDSVANELVSQADALAALVCREVGKPVAEARAEVARCVGIARFHAQAALAPDGQTFPPGLGSVLVYERRSPRGVCALITPWNFPLAIPLWKAAPALAAGNAVVLKPASAALGCAHALLDVLSRHLPDGLIALACGDADVGGAVLDHPGVSCMSFTGSDVVGREIIARAGVRALPVQAEMGGQNPSIVLEDADLDSAAEVIAYAAMAFSGQKCTATSRVVVAKAVLDDFVGKLVAAVERMGVGDPSIEDVQVGPLISEAARQRALDAITQAEHDGAERLCGGEPGRRGFELSPTLLVLRDHQSALGQEEVFAPVAAVVPAQDAVAALEIANEVRFGLSAAIFTSDLAVAHQGAQALEAGLVRINQSTAGVDLHAPFGGIKASSFGAREQGPGAQEFFSVRRTVSVAL